MNGMSNLGRKHPSPSGKTAIGAVYYLPPELPDLETRGTRGTPAYGVPEGLAFMALLCRGETLGLDILFPSGNGSRPLKGGEDPGFENRETWGTRTISSERAVLIH